MFRFPFYGYPYNYNYYRYSNQFPNTNTENKILGNFKAETTEKKEIEKKTELKKEKSSITNSRKISDTTEQAIFEIFGIKLYLDDLIIIGVMYFLYQQNIHDEILYLILFMLLFS